MDNQNDRGAITAAPKPFSYEITPRAAHVGGGWRLQLFEGAFEVGGGIHPITEEVTSDEAYQEAMDDGEAWLMSRCIPSSEVATIKTSAQPDRALTRLTDDDITTIWQTMPGGPAGWLKSFGFLQFARAVEEAVLDNNASTTAPASADNPSTAGAANFKRYRIDSKGLPEFDPCGPWVAFDDVSRLAAPVAQSTAGAAKGGITSLDGVARFYWTKVGMGYGSDGRDQYFLASDVERLLAAPAAQAPVDQDGERWRFMMRAADDFKGLETDLMNEFTGWSIDTYGDGEKDRRPQSVILTEVVDKARAKFAEQSGLRTASKDQQSALGEKGGE